MHARMAARSIFFGLAGAALQLSLFFALVSLLSGTDFARSQFSAYRFYILGLSLGFGVQIGLFTWLRSAVRRKEQASRRVLAASGATSTLAMISCCAHYLANILPVIGISGVASFVGQYQTRIFWVGLAFNLAGIIYISRKIIRFYREA